jgi:hypothetical protein
VIVVPWFFVACICLTVLVQLSEGLMHRRHSHQKPDATTDRAIVALHAIRRRFEVSQLRVEVQREAADAHRRLATELDSLDRREGTS